MQTPYGLIHIHMDNDIHLYLYKGKVYTYDQAYDKWGSSLMLWIENDASIYYYISKGSRQ